MSGWGRFPSVEADVVGARDLADLAAAVTAGPLVPRGLGRSYGDSSLGSRMVEVTGLDRLIAFDGDTGVLTCEAGVSLAEILAVFVPRGWFTPVTPGTRFVTVGGAIASDVHGKNHHVAGSFSDHVRSMRVMVASGEVLDVSREQHPELFRATCGGMGLTGVVVEATIALLPIRSRHIDETVVKAPDLDTALAAFEERASATYSVAWTDLSASGRSLGRSLVMFGEHSDDRDLRAVPRRSSIAVPLDAPSALLNPLTVRAFNRCYYERIRGAVTRHRVNLEPFFYPLDAIADWNRLYGARGFLQYQFVVPPGDGLDALREATVRIAKSGLASPLAVLKVFGPGNGHHLSFPADGYTLAMDLKAGPAAFRLCDDLDRIVADAGGRIYLTKDSRMSPEVFAAGYPMLEEFEEVRRKYGAAGHFVSAQSQRLGLA